MDIEGLVTQLVAAERAPTENRLLQREAELTSEISAFGSFQGALGAFESRVAALGDFSTFNQRNVSSTDEAIVTATASGEAVAASYAVEVDQLATAQSLASGAFDSLTDTVGEGTLTFRFGTTDYSPADPGPESYNGFTVNADRDAVTIEIDSSNNTVQGVADAINAADAGITAVTVNDGSGVRLLISSAQSGAANSLEISVDDSGDGNDGDAAGLSRLAFNASDANLSQTAAGQDAQFRINGLAISSASNTAEDVIDGVTLTLNGISSGTPETLTVSENRGAVRDAIEGFVSAFNRFITTANNLTRFDAETGVAGPLQGDFTARSIISQVRSGVTGAARGLQGAFSTIAEIGITSAGDGTLEIDDARLDRALANNFDSVAGIFTQAGRANNSALAVGGTSAATQLGSYEVVITSVGAPGSGEFEGSIGGEPATRDGSVLVGAAGTAVEGLRVDVGASPALGSLGTVTVSQGIIAPLENLLSGFLGSGAILDTRSEGLQAGIEQIEDDREALNLRLEAIEARFRRQFNALDVLLANLQSTGDFLLRQLDSIPLPGANSDN